MTKKRNWLVLVILTFVMALVWAGVSAVGQIRRSTVSEDVAKAMTPLNPKVDITILSKLKERVK